MRHWMTLALALLVSLAVADSAEAKKNKNKGGDAATTEEPAPVEEDLKAPISLEMATTGIADVDNVFNKAVAPLQTLRDAKTSLDSLSNNLTTVLGLPAGTPFADAINDLKTKAEGKLTLAVDEQGVPALSAGDAVPENVQGAMDAVNNGMKDVMNAVTSLANLPNEFKEVIAAAQGINPKSLISSGVKPTEAPKIMKAITGNIKVLTTAPEELKSFTDSVMNLKNSLTGAFAG